jgi:membrane associated rhomboid family serine protease
VIANVAVFLLATPPLGMPGMLRADALVLVPAYLLQRPWTAVTYQFVHGGFLHLAFNMLGLFFLGPRVEVRLGERRFIQLYLLAGVGGALLSLLTPNAVIVGASGAVLGVVVAFATYWPRERVLLMAVIPMEMRSLVLFFTTASVLFGVADLMGGPATGVAHFAHLGGILGGWGYLRYAEWNSAARKFRRQIESSVPARPGARDLQRWEAVELESLHPLNREEYARVLEKARTLGPPSLSFQERAFLERFQAPRGD